MRRGHALLTVILPILALLVSSVIVANQYARKARLRNELRSVAREYLALEARLPKSAAAKPHDHRDD